MSIEKYGWTMQESLFAYTNQDSAFSNTPKNSKMLNKNFSFFSNTLSASWVAHITGDFLTCYSCSYFSSMIIYIDRLIVI